VGRWYLTFHGGDDSHEWNNIHTYDLSGKPLGKALATHTLPDGIELRELRGFAFGPDGDLYVANAWQDASQVLRFAGASDAEGKHVFKAVFVEQHKTNPGLAHPFDVVFGADGHVYVPSQDSNVVGRYFGPEAKAGEPGSPMPLPEALENANPKHILPGTFVPSHKHDPTPAGVRTVRRSIFGPDGDLFVVDRDAGSVKRYHGGSGAFRREYRHNDLAKPVHAAFRPADGALLVGSRDGNAILTIDIESGEITTLVASGAGGLRAPAGMAFGPDGKLYVASRESKQILRYDAETGKADAGPFIDGLEDYPEFIALVDG
jgi:DNA-binding beta-propeller fold protein YncE